MNLKIPEWWLKPKRLFFLVDNDSWILPYVEELVAQVNDGGDTATLCRNHDKIESGVAAFYLGCTKIVAEDVLKRNHYNLVVHESDLPKGRGFAPLTWQILEGKNVIPICLIEAAKDSDTGNIYFRDKMIFKGHELGKELRHTQGLKTQELCKTFLASPEPPIGVEQKGKPNRYPRRKPADSELDISTSIAKQLNLLRVVDNERYPAFFSFKGHRYKVKIDKIE